MEMNDRKRRLNDLLDQQTTSLQLQNHDNRFVKRKEENQEQTTSATITVLDRRPMMTVDDVSLYAMLRRWTRDDQPSSLEKQRMESEQKEKPTKMTVQMDNQDNIQLLITGEKTLSDYSVLFQNTKFSKADSQRRLNEHVVRYKKIRNRSKLVVASRYSRLRDQLAAKQIPPLAALEMILEDCRALSTGPFQ